MTMTDATETAHASGNGPAALLRGLLVGGAFGAGVAAIVVGGTIGKVAVWGSGIAALALLVLTTAAFSARHRVRRPVVERVKAVAMIESRRATSGEYADVPVAFDLTVAPDDRPAFRAHVHRSVNLVDLPDFPVRGIVVVEYPPDRPWDVTIVSEPDAEWASRAARASLDSAPESTRVRDPEKAGPWCAIAVLGMLAGAAVVVLVFRGDLFTDDPAKPSSSATSPGAFGGSGRSGGSGSTSTTVSRSVTTADVSTSILIGGQLRATSDALLKAGVSTAVSVSVTDRRMTARGTKPDEWAPGQLPVVLTDLPYERMPELVREARTNLGVTGAGAGSWRIDIARDAKTRAVVIRVTVTGGNGTADVQADGTGRITATHSL
ncbi:hypothetical protein [Streptomyces sp. NPDC008317]|uniref:hypothetical protein n=1 Tax=Streptomyces sp. NPDC008317 TaxID=3364827 RepID=UPI0036E4266D